MNKIIFKYLLSNYFKIIFKTILIFYCFGIVLNLFEEIEFFKNLETTIIIPITLTALYIPSMIIKLLPFIIFISSMWYLLSLRNNKDLLSLKIFGYSNFKIFFILASTSFIFGWLILFLVNPITSSMMQYYENSKSKYSLDVDHLVSINKNGLWIKENVESGYRIITADEPTKNILNNVTIFNLDEKYNLVEKIFSKKASILENDWILNDTSITKFEDGVNSKLFLETYSINSKYDYEKITSLFRNFDTMSFLDLILN